MLSFKITGVIFIFLCGLYFSLDVKKRYDKRLQMLELFLKDFNFFLNEISFLKTPVNEIISKLNKDKNKGFYSFLLNYYKTLCEEELTKMLLSEEYCLCKKDAQIISDFYKCLGTSDYENQINSLKIQTELLKERIKEGKKDKERNQKSRTALTMCSFIVIIIFLV